MKLPYAADASSWLGKTHRIAKLVLKDVPLLQSAPPDPLDRCYLFTGPAGTGKTMRRKIKTDLNIYWT